MDNRKIEGKIRFKPLVRWMIADEWTFAIKWEWSGEKKEIRIGHWKGDWTVAKFVKGEYKGWFQISDSFSIETSEPLLEGLLKFFIEKYPIAGENSDWRDKPAAVILSVIEIWAEKVQAASEILVIQPGRNGQVLEGSGEWSLSPKEEEFGEV